MKRNMAQRLALMGLLLSLMIILGYIEHLLPLDLGVPGIKLGLANSVLLFGLYMLGVKETFILMALKVISPLLYNPGYLQTLIYSLSGALLSILGMLLIKQIKGFSIIGVSIVGAVLHNLGQILMAIIVLNLRANIFMLYIAFLMLTGVVTGVLTGIAAKTIMKSLKVAPDKRLSDKPKS